jgi:hypothetical protein
MGVRDGSEGQGAVAEILRPNALDAINQRGASFSGRQHRHTIPPFSLTHRSTPQPG